MTQEVRVEGSWDLNLLHGLGLLRRLGSIRGASTLTLAGILARVLLVAAALALAIVLSFAGVLGQVLLIGCYRDTGKRGGAGSRFRVSGNRLGVETGSGAAKKAGESCGQHEVVCIVALHEEFLSSVGHRALCLGILITTCCRWLGRVHSDFNECTYLAACLKLREADGYSLSRHYQKGIVVAPRIAPWWGS